MKTIFNYKFAGDEFEPIESILDSYAQMISSSYFKSVNTFTLKARQQKLDSSIGAIADPRLAAKLIAEEAIETINALGFNVVSKLGGGYDLSPITIAGVGHKEPDIKETIDGLCDTMYVCLWTFAALGLPDKPFMQEVCENNLLKVIDPKFDENGKVMKPVGHPKPRIKQLLAKMLPRYKHDCNRCLFLGQQGAEDCYICPLPGESKKFVLTKRYGDEVEENRSVVYDAKITRDRINLITFTHILASDLLSV